MAKRIAINGFGRIGRLAFRQLFGMEGYEVAAINDLASPEILGHLLQYDTAQGRYAKNVTYTENALVVEGTAIPILAQKDPAALPWAKYAIDLVLECTGHFASAKAAQAHLQAGAGKVLVSTGAGSDVPTIVYGINEKVLTGEDRIVSAASCTTNCLAPMAYHLHALAPIDKGFMTTIHAYTSDQNIQDGPHGKGDKRRARAAAGNIIPTSTGAAKNIGLVIPALEGRLGGTSQRVPVLTGSLTELTAVVAGEVTAGQVNDAMKNAATPEYGYTETPLVSSDIIGMEYGGLFDATQTAATSLTDGSTLVKICAWYDNESSFTSQMVKTGKYMLAL